MHYIYSANAQVCLIHICRNQNPDIQRAGRYETAHGSTARLGADGQHRTPTRRFAQKKTFPLISEHVLHEKHLQEQKGVGLIVVIAGHALHEKV